MSTLYLAIANYQYRNIHNELKNLIVFINYLFLENSQSFVETNLGNIDNVHKLKLEWPYKFKIIPK